MPFNRRKSLSIGAFSALLWFGMVGCGKDDIRSYSAPKRQAPAASAAHESGQAARSVELISWTLPADWEEQPGSGMRHATLLIPAGETPIEVRVTPLALGARDPLANINRWRQQIDLEPIGADELDSVIRPVQAGDHTLQLVNLVGPDRDDKPAEQILAAILEGSQQVWFFTIFDTVERAAPHAAAFEEFLGTVRLAPAPGMAGHPPIGTGAPAAAHVATVDDGSAPGITWTTPAGWKRQARASQMRIATFDVGEGDETGEVTITSFPGDVGGLLANVNRWREQLGMEPIEDVSDQPIDAIEIDGQRGGLIDLLGGSATTGGGDASATRMRIAQIARPDGTWFFKFTGPDRLVTRQRDSFAAFIASIHFTGGDGD